MPDNEEFTCERCGEECDDPSYQPLCPIATGRSSTLNDN